MLVDQTGRPVGSKSVTKRIHALFLRGKVVLVSFAAFVAAFAALLGNLDKIRATLGSSEPVASSIIYPRVKVLVGTPMRDSDWKVMGLAERGEEYEYN